MNNGERSFRERRGSLTCNEPNDDEPTPEIKSTSNPSPEDGSGKAPTRGRSALSPTLSQRKLEHRAHYRAGHNSAGDRMTVKR
jgi:hypothetical protein